MKSGCYNKRFKKHFCIDRGNDNWLIRYEAAPVVEGNTCIEHERDSMCEVCEVE